MNLAPFASLTKIDNQAYFDFIDNLAIKVNAKYCKDVALDGDQTEAIAKDFLKALNILNGNI